MNKLNCNEPEDCFNCPYPDCRNNGLAKTIVKDKNHQQRPIFKTDLEGNFIKKFKGITECCKEEGYSHSLLSKRISKKNSLNGFMYMYPDDYKPPKIKDELVKLDRLNRIVGFITLADLAKEYKTTEGTMEYKIRRDLLRGDYHYMFKREYAEQQQKKEASDMGKDKKPAKRGRPRKFSEDPIEVVEEIVEEVVETVDDTVNHPSHYCTGDIECWDAMCSAFGIEWMMHYAVIAAFKYDWRAKHKGKFAEDMRKASWYNIKAAELSEVFDAQE